NEFIKHTRTNLVLGQASSVNVRTSTTNLRLQGNYLWNLIGADNEVVAVIDPGPRQLDRSLLVVDFCALEFACGVPLSTPGGLIGLDANGTSVAWMSASAFVRELYTREIPADPPVPNFLSTDASCWVAEFFQSLAKEFASPGERASWVAFGSYLASLY